MESADAETVASRSSGLHPQVGMRLTDSGIVTFHERSKDDKAHVDGVVFRTGNRFAAVDGGDVGLGVEVVEMASVV
jgi:hypothetical protein